MDILALVTGGAVAALTAVHALTTLITAVRQRRTDRRAAGENSQIPAVTLIRPLRGVEPFSHATLMSTFKLSPAPAEILLCIAQADDPIIPLVERIIAEHPDVPARLLVGRDVMSGNPKLNNLAKGWREARCDWVAFIDSNVLLPTQALTHLWSMVERTTGMVCSPPVGTLPQGFAAKLECAFLNCHQARWQSSADAVGNGFAQGKAMFFHRSVIDEAGGIEALGVEAAEDAAATKLVRARGLNVRLVDRFFPQPIGVRTFRDVWNRQVRWAKLRRSSFPISFAAEIISGGMAPLLLTAIFSALIDAPVVPAVMIVACTWYLTECLLARFLGWPSTLIYAVLRDLLMPIIWVKAWVSSDFSWHGHEMRADRARPVSGSEPHIGHSQSAAL